MHLKTFYIGLYFKDGKSAAFKCISLHEVRKRFDIDKDIWAFIYFRWYSATALYAYGIITESGSN